MNFYFNLIGLCAVLGLAYSHYTPDRSEACSETEFSCESGACIPNAWICDGDEDCGGEDISDEQNCPPTECNEFVCPNGRCISSAWICDNEDDCGDMSDEQNCPETTIGPCTGFVCPNGVCIPRQWTCDGYDDCEDNSDETEEACPCVDNETRCPQPSDSQTPGACIPPDYYCDQIWDCLDGSDEANCTATFNANEPHYRPETVAARKLQRKMKKNRRQSVAKNNKKQGLE